MKILLPLFDLYQQNGGGETIYQKIIQANLDKTFYYFRLDEAKYKQRPANTIAVPFKYYYGKVQTQAPVKDYLYDNFLLSMNMAKALVALATHFDFIDTPDYLQNGIFIRDALAHHGIQVGTVYLSLHGVVSGSLAINWPASLLKQTRTLAKLKNLENLQYQTVDHRYGISETYAKKWQNNYKNLAAQFVDPLVFLERAKTFATFPAEKKPNVLSIARKEKTKGLDIFIDLIWFLNKKNYAQAIVAGGDDVSGKDSQFQLKNIAHLRQVKITELPNLERHQVLNLFRQKNILVVASRYDTLNLVALEALLNGCPAVISQQCGVVDYLKKYLPTVPFYEIDTRCSRAGAVKINEVLVNYDAARENLMDAIRSLPHLDKYTILNSLYQPQKTFSAHARLKVTGLFYRCLAYQLQNAKQSALTMGNLKNNVTLRKLSKSILGQKFYTLQKILWMLRYFKNPKKLANNVMMKDWLHTFVQDPKALAQWFFTLKSKVNQRRNSVLDLEAALKHQMINRQKLYALLSALVGEDDSLIGAVYDARLMRWQANPSHEKLKKTQLTFLQHGYQKESIILPMLLNSEAHGQQFEFLSKALARHKQKPILPVEHLYDMRNDAPVKVSVIVSLYNAADKLFTFIDMILQQTITSIEIIFIDSGSPGQEYEVYLQHVKRFKRSVYLRSKQRETIQCAWNRGIQIATGEYLAFLGVDECVHPECFEKLANVLDTQAHIDWAMGNAFVAEIDHAERLMHDGSPYRRDSAKHHSHILDCTYFSYVGGLYRKSIHDRFGFYDESFSAAGDTEFKNRILPFIQIKYLPEMLGAFNNYQEVRTTAHPRAEIEDLRAWYLFRTPGGIAYLFQHKSEDQLLALLQDTLQYRKAYLDRTSTDMDLGLSASLYLNKQYPSDKNKKILQSFMLLKQLLNRVENLKAQKPLLELFVIQQKFFKLKKSLAKQLNTTLTHRTSMFHDNRFEQHWWPWSLKESS